ncbi:GIY-YIG nuclease family protein [Kaistia dalseonensis]|uniref:GIY-YIG nuclease family protein n=1 Tax=Kaistia dalseonensis TaxID=410840 RepID=A0ABU0H631_9HYPH|nr:GIY-YIG nuclease family protein [Kaistia dalseonensis]MCX5495181.1 GIY-YIG nuclease family protein [Kaistia dalseonensis]MDQ0437765.1 hypothetical protein [Kaistia dalseonensis]
MKIEDRKAAVAAYKKRESPSGIYLIRCAATGDRWVGQTPDLDAIQNRIWFTLNLGSHTAPTLQAAWRDHGAASLGFEVLERLEKEETAYIQKALLKERCAHWRAALDAQPL